MRNIFAILTMAFVAMAGFGQAQAAEQSDPLLQLPRICVGGGDTATYTSIPGSNRVHLHAKVADTDFVLRPTNVPGIYKIIGRDRLVWFRPGQVIMIMIKANQYAPLNC